MIAAIAGNEIGPAHAGEKQKAAANDAKQSSSTEVGLGQRKHGRRPNHKQRGQHGIGTPHLLRRQPLVVARKCENERDLHDLRWLEAVSPKAEPTLSTAALHADQRNRRKHDEYDDVERIGGAHPPAHVDERDCKEEPEPDAVADHMTARPRLERAPGHRIKRDHADAGDGGDEQDRTAS